MTGVNKRSLYILAVLICLCSAPSCTDPRQDAPDGWKTYEHNRDRTLSGACSERPNFAFEVPSSWNLEQSTCDFVGFVAANEPAELQAVVLDLAVSRAAAKRTTRVSKSRENVRSSVQHKCHSVRPGWYQMTTLRKPRGMVALEDPRHPGIC